MGLSFGDNPFLYGEYMKKRLVDMTWKESPVWMNVFNGVLMILFLLMFLMKSKALAIIWLVAVFGWLLTVMFAPKIEVRKWKGK